MDEFQIGSTTTQSGNVLMFHATGFVIGAIVGITDFSDAKTYTGPGFLVELFTWGVSASATKGRYC